MENQKEMYSEVSNQIFNSKIDLNPYIQYDALARIIFVNCEFNELNLLGKVFGSCEFINCKFSELSFRKCEIYNCKFENCKFENCDMTRTNFNYSKLTNSKIIQSDLRASYFFDCEFNKIIFKNNNLDNIIGRNIKFWKLNELIEIKESSNFEKTLEENN